MRISDWSSDVCSSDLAVEGVDIIAVGANDLTAAMGCPGQVREPAVIAAFERIAAAANRYGRIAVVGGVPDDEYYPAILELGFSSLDRTSVGEGKSGSVRVDLGGRRHIKNKQQSKIKIKK